MWISTGGRELSLTYSSNITRCSSYFQQSPYKGKCYSTQSTRPRPRVSPRPPKFATVQSPNRRPQNIRDQNSVKYSHETQPISQRGVEDKQFGQITRQWRTSWLSAEARYRVENSVNSQAEKRTIEPKDETFRYEFLLREASLYPEFLTHVEWKKNFATVLNGRLREISPSVIWDRLSGVESQSDVCSWIRELEDSDGKISWPSDSSLALSRKKAARRWPNIALWLLLNRPGEALTFLQTTPDTFSPPVNMVANCFYYLEHFHSREFEHSEQSKALYDRTVSDCLQPHKWSIVRPSQTCIRLYLKHTNSQGVQTALKHIEHWEFILPIRTLLYLLDRTMECGSMTDSLRVLGLIQKSTPEALSTLEVLQRCARLLTLAHQKGDEPPLQALQKIQDIGVKPNLDIYNALISGAVRDNNHELAWSTLDIMVGHGIEPDSYTLLSLLDDAAQRSNFDDMDYILQRIDQKESLMKQPHIVSKILHAILVHSRQSLTSVSEKADCFRRMLEVYRRAHDPAPLVELGILRPDAVTPPDESVTPPSSHALFIMITAYLKMTKSTLAASQLFHRFRELVVNGHGVIAPLSETDHIYNSFLMAFNPDINRLDDCVMVVETMLQPLPKTALLRNQDNRPVRQAAPTTQTWTILLLALFRHQQPQTVSRVRELMQERGIKPVDVTWDVMVQGYARMQMVEETAMALKQMERENWNFSAHTIRGTGYLNDQEALRRILQSLDANDDDTLDQPRRSVNNTH